MTTLRAIWEWLRPNLLPAAGAVLIVGLLYYHFVDPSPPTTVLSARVVTPEVAAGSDLTIAYQVDRHRICPERVERILYDGAAVRHVLPEESLTIPGMPGVRSFQVNVAIPANAVAGPSVLREVHSYTCSLYHNISPIVVTMPNLRFLIKEK